MSARPVAIEVRGRAYHYPDGTPALRALDLTILPGERVALLGPNGAGKSTLLLHLAGLLPERHRYVHEHGHRDAAHGHGVPGSIHVDGELVDPLRPRAVRERVGIVFSDPDDQLFSLTVEEDVGFGPRARGWSPDRVDDSVRRALAAVRLEGYEARAPHHLSAGEKRRACLAGVLACEPGLLLLDEPTSDLDPRGRRELAALLAGLPATMVVATHDLAFAERLCPRSIVLDGGAIVADRPTRSLLSDAATLERHGLA